uniref:Minor capsid protein P8 central region domain-containing protein n=1 Tax=viral metagenome TaxID=1070528 RepID=A0A6C0B7T4_9ZZZZ
MSYKDINPVSIDDNSHIIGPTYNGRINLIEQPPTEVLFAMQEKISIRNKATEFREALTGVWESTTLSNLFFSAENIQIIQNGLRAGVYQLSNQKYIIAPQNVDTLKIIMRSMYLQYAEHGINDITGQIERLNKLVLDYAVPAVFGEATGYEKYCQDQSTLVVPLRLPQHVDREYKQLMIKPFM